MEDREIRITSVDDVCFVIDSWYMALSNLASSVDDAVINHQIGNTLDKFNSSISARTELALTGPKGYNPESKCVLPYNDAPNMPAFLLSIIKKFWSDATPGQRNLMKNKYNDVLRIYINRFSPKEVYIALGSMVDNSTMSDIFKIVADSNLLTELVTKLSTKTEYVISSPGRLFPGFIKFADVASLIKYIESPIEGYTGLQEDFICFKTNLLLSFIIHPSDYITDDSVSDIDVRCSKYNDIVCELYKSIRDEITASIKDLTNYGDAGTEKPEFKLPKIFTCIEPARFLLLSYKSLLDMGNVNDVINEYLNSVDDDNSEEVVKASEGYAKSVDRIRYYITSVFQEILSNERLASRVFTAELVTFILSEKPNDSFAAMQIYSIVSSMYMKRDFVSEHYNPYYLHFTYPDINDERDVAVANMMICSFGFNIRSIESQCMCYDEDAITRTIFGIRLSFTRYLYGTAKMLGDTSNIPTIDSVKCTISRKISEYSKSIAGKKITIAMAKKSSDRIDADNEVKECESIIEGYNKALKVFDSSIEAFDNLMSEYDKLKSNISKLNSVGYNSLRGVEVRDYAKDWIWPRRIVCSLPSDHKKDNDIETPHYDELKPGDIFSGKYESTTKPACD